MSPKLPINIPASIRQRLLNKAKAENRPFNELLQYFAMERFLYRLSKSPHADKFVLKGALMLRVWQSPETRPTMDIDFLGKTSNVQSDIANQIQDILFVEVEPDGLNFDISSIKTEHITEDADYEGVRIKFRGELDSARLNMRIDIGFGDAVVPAPEVMELPAVLDLPSPKLLCYSRESSIAEKFIAMLTLGELNSRMKDFYDVWLLCRRFDFDGDILSEAIKCALKRRLTSVPDNIIAFSDTFAENKQVQWTAFRRRLNDDQIPELFKDIVRELCIFILPIILNPCSDDLASMRWTAPGPWK